MALPPRVGNALSIFAGLVIFVGMSILSPYLGVLIIVLLCVLNAFSSRS